MSKNNQDAGSLTSGKPFTRLNPDPDDRYVDENGTTWTRPTAWAYYAVCKARDNWQIEAQRFERELIEARQEIEQLHQDAAGESI